MPILDISHRHTTTARNKEAACQGRFSSQGSGCQGRQFLSGEIVVELRPRTQMKKALNATLPSASPTSQSLPAVRTQTLVSDTPRRIHAVNL